MKILSSFRKITFSFILLIAFVVMAVATGDSSNSSNGQRENGTGQSNRDSYEDTPEIVEEEDKPEPDWESESNESDPVEIGEDDPIFEGGMED